MNHLEKAQTYAEVADRTDLTPPMRAMNAELARLHLELHRAESTSDLEARVTEIEKALA